MTAQEKYDAALKFQEDGFNDIYEAIMKILTDDELMELLNV
jgi:hypothetical protein